MTLNFFSGRILRSTVQVFALIALVGVLSACVGGRASQTPAQLDLGAAAARSARDGSLSANVPILVPAATSAALLTDRMVVWRIGDLGQPQAYSTYQWIAPPAHLVTQRLIDRLSQQGAVLPQNLGGELPQIRTNLQRFEQTFSVDGSSSRAQLTMQVVLLKGAKVVNQLLVDISVPAKSQDALGGAEALREATNQSVEQVAQWLTKELKRND